MTIAVGDRIPDVEVFIPDPGGPKRVSTDALLGHGKVVVFGVPGAFTPACSDVHLPGYVLHADEFRDKGVDTVACVAVNDAFVMGAWGKARETDDKVVMVADGSAVFTRALGLDIDLTGGGLGVRSKRYAAVLSDGVVTDLAVEEGLGVDVSSADAVLAKL